MGGNTAVGLKERGKENRDLTGVAGVGAIGGDGILVELRGYEMLIQ
jgi:hypothetical protein